MKKAFSILAILFVCVLCMPLLSACGGEGNTKVTGVRFTQDVYELDLNTPTQIPYKVYPSTASDYYVSFDPLSSDPNAGSKFTLKSGVMTIVRDTFTSVTLRISVAGYTDECTVKLKNYPLSIDFETDEDVVNSNGIYNLKLKATIQDPETDEIETKYIDSNDYNIVLESSNPRVLAIDDPSKLVVRSTGKSGSATITANIYDGDGDKIITYENPQGLKTSMDLTVIDNVEKAVAVLQGQSEFLYLSNSYVQTDLNTYSTSASSLTLDVYLFADTGVYLVDCEIAVISANTDIAEVTTSGSGFVITLKDRTADDKRTERIARIEISSTATDVNGNPVKFIFFLNNLD